MSVVLVTGGAGFIGSHLIDFLAQDPAMEIVVLDNLHRGRRAHLEELLARERVRLVKADVRDAAAVDRWVSASDLVFHLAAQSNVVGSMQDTRYCFESNVVGTFNLLDACTRGGVRRVVFTSSREVYGEATALPVPEDAPLRPKNAYGVSKLAGESYCTLFAREHGLDVRVLRLANVYGPRDFGRVIPIFVENALRGEPLVIYGGGQVIDFVSVADVVAALAEAGLREEPLPGAVNVGSGAGTTLQELAERVLAETGSASEVRVVPARSYEVERFTADLARFQATFQRKTNPPLHGLSEVVTDLRARLNL